MSRNYNPMARICLVTDSADLQSIEVSVIKDSYSEMSSEPSFSDYIKNYSSAANMTSDWASGAGAKYRVFNNTSETRAMKNAVGVVAARNLFYSKKDPNASVTNFGYSFGLSGLARAGLDATEQFIGSYSIEIHSNGKALQFSIFNTTSSPATARIPPLPRESLRVVTKKRIQ